MNVVVGGIYKHFKGHTYKVLTLAKNSETLEDEVVYQNIETGEVWVRPLLEFVSPVDKNKYPDVKQEMRFSFIK